MMREAILKFPKQFEYQPVIENAGHLGKTKRFVVCGMGGSALAPMLFSALKPDLDILIHKDYGLPASLSDSEDRLIILSSYSGNTEEVIDSFQRATALGLPRLAISTGGQLTELAKDSDAPYILLPDTGIQPRSALGFSFLALLLAVGEKDLLNEARELGGKLSSQPLESAGQGLAGKIKGLVPVIYSSLRNLGLAYNWKIKLNETGKAPAFYNVLPELNHNEMTGFDVVATTRALSEKFVFIFLNDDADTPSVKKRFEILEKLYVERGLKVENYHMSGDSALEKVFSALLVADFLALYTAQNYGVESEQVPMVEQFKKLMAE